MLGTPPLPVRCRKGPVEEQVASAEVQRISVLEANDSALSCASYETTHGDKSGGTLRSQRRASADVSTLIVLPRIIEKPCAVCSILDEVEPFGQPDLRPHIRAVAAGVFQRNMGDDHAPFQCQLNPLALVASLGDDKGGGGGGQVPGLPCIDIIEIGGEGKRPA